jgi:hypothetical protein
MDDHSSPTPPALTAYEPPPQTDIPTITEPTPEVHHLNDNEQTPTSPILDMVSELIPQPVQETNLQLTTTSTTVPILPVDTVNHSMPKRVNMSGEDLH